MYLKKEWKSIKDYEGSYEISNYGEVKSLAKQWIAGKGGIRKKKDTIMKVGINGDGYCYINLCKNGKQKSYKISLLVYDHFGKGKRNGMILQVDHINNNKLIDRIDNLQLLTARQNAMKGFIQNGKKTSKYTGVCWYEKYKQWRAYIKIDKKQKPLGYFKDEHKAHLAYQKALKKII